MQELYKDSDPPERKHASLRINCLYFFLSASYVTLWPWVPLILLYAGCTLSKIGLVVFLLQILYVLSVKLALSSIYRTKNGSLRRCALFILSVLSFLFGMVALLITPYPKSETFCTSLQAMPVNTLPANNKSMQATLGNDEQLYHHSIKNEGFDTLNDTFLPRVTNFNNIINNANKTSPTLWKKSSNDISKNFNEDVNNGENLGTSQPEDFELNKNYYNAEVTKDIKPDERVDFNSLYDDYNLLSYDKEDVPSKLTTRNKFQNDQIMYRPHTKSEHEFHNNRLSLIPSRFNDMHLRSNRREDYKINNHRDSSIKNYNSDKVRSKTLYPSEHKRSKRSNETIVKTTEIDNEIQITSPELKLIVIFAIFVTLSFSAVLGGGIEIAINRLWHCYIYGIPHDSGFLDGMECTVIPPIKSPFIGDHKIWSSCTSCLWLLIITIVIWFACSIELIISPFKIMCVFFFTSEFLKCIMLLNIYVPFGDICFARSNRTLGLYLDNEVIEEGMRRIAFHAWVLITGIIISLPFFYTIILIQEAQALQKEIWIAQTAAISASLLGEAILLVSDRWLTRKINIGGMMILTVVSIAIQNAILWHAKSIWIKSASALLVGVAHSAVLVSVTINSQTLGTLEDQKREAWISWTCFKFGMGIGSLIWTAMADTKWFLYSLQNVLPISTSFAILTSCVICISTVVCSRRKKNKRIYHTLDIHGTSDDDDSEINLNEDDWLVKRANKEGFQL